MQGVTAQTVNCNSWPPPSPVATQYYIDIIAVNMASSNYMGCPYSE